MYSESGRDIDQTEAPDCEIELVKASSALDVPTSISHHSVRPSGEEDEVPGSPQKIESSSSVRSVTGSGWVNICRICHAGMSLGNLVSPCECRGSIALAHLECLERWLKESEHSSCELCQHHFEIICEPKYSVLMSVLVFLRHPGEHARELILDMLGFLIYTPSAAVSTYRLMLLYESIYKSEIPFDHAPATVLMAFLTIFAMAAIDFTYSSWLMACLQKHTEAWRIWYRNNRKLKVILPKAKLCRKSHRDGSIE